MVNCQYCNYYIGMSSLSVKKTNAVAVCSFADVLLFTDGGNEGMEYPCRHISYQEYLNRERTPVSTSKLKPEDWKFTYKRKHYVAERDRSKNAG